MIIVVGPSMERPDVEFGNVYRDSNYALSIRILLLITELRNLPTNQCEELALVKYWRNLLKFQTTNIIEIIISQVLSNAIFEQD